MDILYLLIPLSAVLVLVIIAVFGWALHNGQFDDLDREGERILDPNVDIFDDNQSPTTAWSEKSRPSKNPVSRPEQSRPIR